MGGPLPGKEREHRVSLEACRAGPRKEVLSGEGPPRLRSAGCGGTLRIGDCSSRVTESRNSLQGGDSPAEHAGQHHGLQDGCRETMDCNSVTLQIRKPTPKWEDTSLQGKDRPNQVSRLPAIHTFHTTFHLPLRILVPPPTP